jgi:hypothetical protein
MKGRDRRRNGRELKNERTKRDVDECRVQCYIETWHRIARFFKE